MSEMSDMFKLVNQMELAKKARVGTSLTYFDVIILLDELYSLYEYIDELEAERIEWVFEDQLPDGIPDAVYSAMYACSEVVFVRVFPSVTVDGRKRFLIELPEVK